MAAAALLVALVALVVGLIAVRMASRGGRQRLLDHRHTVDSDGHRITTSWVYGVQADLLVKEKPL